MAMDGDMPTVILPTEGNGRSMRVQIEIEGPTGRIAIPLLFDTGATLTTLNQEALDALGIQTSNDGPLATLQTAGGPIDSPVVLLERVWLGDVAIDQVAAAICESCAQEDSRGLLGLNVTGLFDVTIRPGEAQVELDPLDLEGDRHLDVGHWLSLGSTATVWWTGSVEVEVEVVNAAAIPITEVVTEVACVDRSFAVQLNDLPAQGRSIARASLPKGTDCSTYQVSLLSARW